MKKILLTFVAVASFCTVTMAQAPDFGFEAWTNIPFSATIKDPNGWASLNTLTLVGSPQSVFEETVAPYAGTTSCKITTVDISGAAIPNPFRPGQNFDTAGIVGIGKVTTVPAPSIKFGYPLLPGAGRPANLAFASKYTPVTGDSAFVAAYLTRWNGASRDTIAKGKYGTGTASSSYAVNNILMTYDPAFSTVWADTMLVFATSSIYTHGGAKIGSTFWVDDFAWSGYNSVNEIGQQGSVSVFPNPAVNHITFNSTVNATEVEIMDVTGRKVGVFAMTNNSVRLETTGYSSGIYLFNVINKEKQVINRGKFEIAK